MKRIAIIVVGVALGLGVGCGQSDSMSSMPSERGCVGAEVLGMTVSPQELTRGADEDLIVRITLDQPTQVNPAVELLAETGVRARVVLELGARGAQGSGWDYSGSIVNPFGAGLPAGDVTVRLIRGDEWDCFSASPGTTSFALK